MSIFSKLFGKRQVNIGRVESEDVSGPGVENGTLQLVEEVLIAQREQTLARMNEWLDSVNDVLQTVKERLRAQNETLYKVEASAQKQLQSLTEISSSLKEHGKKFEEISASLEGLPSFVATLPQLSEQQRILLEQMDKKIREQIQRSESVMEIFREVSAKIDVLPQEGRKQADILRELLNKLDTAAKQETAIRQNIETLHLAIKEASTYAKQQIEAIKMLETSQRLSMKELLQENKRYSRWIMILLAILIGCISLFSIIGIILLLGR